MTAPLPVCSAKLSMLRLGQYYGEWSRWNPECCSLLDFLFAYFFFHVCEAQKLIPIDDYRLLLIACGDVQVIISNLPLDIASPLFQTHSALPYRDLSKVAVRRCNLSPCCQCDKDSFILSTESDKTWPRTAPTMPWGCSGCFCYSRSKRASTALHVLLKWNNPSFLANQ